MIKKEFITYWTPELVLAKLTQMTYDRAKFFNRTVKGVDRTDTEIIVPDSITYDQLCIFIGRKTKVTIETVD